MKRKKGLLYVILLVLACVFTACGTPAEKSEKEIATDLQQAIATSNEAIADFRVSSIEVEKRRTDKDSGVDTVYVWLDVENAKVKGTIGYTVEYVLYDEGWILEDISTYERGMWAFTPLVGIDEVTANTDIQEYKDLQWQLVNAETDLEQGICTYYYQGEESLYNGYCVEKHDVALEYVFDKSSGFWNEPRKNTTSYESWEYLVGTWQTSADVGLWTLYGHPKRTAHVDLTLVIDDVTETDLHAVVWYQDACIFDERVELKSDGFEPFKVILTAIDSDGGKVELKEEIWLTLTRYEGIMFSDDAFALFVKQ